MKKHLCRAVLKTAAGFIITFAFLTAGNTLNAQSTLDLRINEVLVYNDSSYTDDYGMHVPWIEIFNSAYNSVNIGGLYLTDDLNIPRKYFIPKGDPRTRIPSRYYVVFFADSNTDKGVFHLNFTLKEDGIIALFDSDGRTLIDSVTISAGQKKDITFGRVSDGADKWALLEKATPNANNNTNPGKSSGEIFTEFDPTGVGLTAIAMSVVFIALIMLYLIYKWIGRSFTSSSRKPVKSKGSEKQHGAEDNSEYISGEVNAAIAMTIHLYQNELHDLENPILTIQKVSRTYSPWSSKIYSLRKQPNR